MFLKLVLSLVLASIVTSAFDVADDVRGAQNFALKLLKSEYEKSENKVFSPFSIRVLLSILYQSSSGSTENELRENAFLGDKITTLAAQTDVYKSLWTNPSVTLGNKIYLALRGNLRRETADVVHSFNSEIEQVDFRENVIVSAEMNEWISKKTHGLITDLVTPSSMSEDTAVFLINTLYFKAKWARQFDPESVYPMNFTNHKGEVRKIPFMNKFGYYRYGNSAKIGAEIVEIPYEENTNMEFLVVFPHLDSSVESVVEKFNPETFNEFQNSSHESGMILHLPVFETESSLDIKSALMNIGISSLFMNAEMRLVENSPPLLVNKAKQKTKIIVNTEGTEAASASFMELIPVTIWPEIYLNRPFFYMVVTRDKKIPLFVGNFSE